ncbi:MAG: alpha/beta hydrolase [Proteobacteria bacterium]|nr:alpha/beta hydrolase [Pseudomonadota bacterium]
MPSPTTDPQAGQPRSTYVKVGASEVHVTEWGRPGAESLVMWHGLARTGRDFDVIAGALADRFHVVCPDTIGRGLSEWSTDPDRDYCMDAYAQLALGVVEALRLGRTISWLGTSMGGALGIRVAATTLAGRLRKLIINDIGPTFPEAPFERIKAYVGKPPEFSTVGELEAYFRTIYKPFGAHTDAQWRHMAETSLRRLPSGKLTTHYDPAIVRQMFAHPRDYEQWEHWDRIAAPTMVLRGVESDLLLSDTAEAMMKRGPKAAVVQIPGCGHAPALNVESQIGLVRAFLID